MRGLTKPYAALPIDPIPAPRAAVQRLMLATAIAIDGYVDQSPHEFAPHLANSFVMPEANAVLMGTGCSRPLLLREGIALASIEQLDLLIVRTVITPGHATFDAKLYHDDRVFLAYRLWQPRQGSTPWLIPSLGEGPCLRLAQNGFSIEDEMPFYDWADRQRGMAQANELLSITAEGWL